MPDVLIATDADAVFAEVEAALADDTTTVRRVRSGAEVGPSVKGSTPDLVVLDLQIGNMGGVAVAIDLRLEESGGRLPRARILLLLDRRDDAFIARRADVDLTLVKPVDAGILRRAAAPLLADAAAERENGDEDDGFDDEPATS
jgi:DNA-binding response OmpR family regulator